MTMFSKKFEGAMAPFATPGYAFDSNASTNFNNPLLVRVWPMCLSVKLYLRRLLFMQNKIMWLVRIHLCRHVGIRLNR